MKWLPAVPVLCARAIGLAALFASLASSMSAQWVSITGAWQSPQGALTLEHPALAGTAVMVTGTWETPLGRARITRGAYDPAARLMAFAFAQDGSGVTGQAKFTVAADGSRLTGSFTLAGGPETPWELTRAAAGAAAVLSALTAAAPPPAPGSVAAVAPPGAPAVRSVAGVWDSSFGAVTLQQDAPTLASWIAVRGYHDESPGHRAEIRDGKFDPATGVLEFAYVQAWRNVSGTGRFTLSPDNARLAGTYNQTGSSGAWNLDRRGAAPAVAAMTAPASTPAVATPAAQPARSVAGTWNSKLGAVTLQHAPVTGSAPVAVVGFHDESRDHRAELRDGKFDPVAGTLEFTYFQSWRNVTGTGRFVLSADNNRLSGTYSQPGATGPWELERPGATAATPTPVATTRAAASPADSPGAQLAVALIGALLGGATQQSAAPVQPAAAPRPAPAPVATAMPAPAPAAPVVERTMPAPAPTPAPVVAAVPTPAAPAASGARAVAVAARSEYTLVLRDDGTVWAFGNNSTGGHVHQGKPRPAVEGTPVQITELTDIVAIAAGEIHALALDRQGVVWVWGENKLGERGSGRTDKDAWRTPPSRVEGLPPIAAIVAGGSNEGWSGMCVARGFDGSLWHWGRRITAPPESARSDQTYVHANLKPEKLSGLPSGAERIVGATRSLLIVQRGGVLLRWGQRDSYFYGTPPQPTAVAGLSGVAVAGEHDGTTIAVAQDGSVWGWGYPKKELAIPRAEMGVEGTPTALAGTWKATNPRTVAVGSDFAAILQGDGTVWTWGRNDYGQLGSGTADKTIRAVPERVPGLADVVELATGTGHSVALKKDGSVWVWGSGWSGRLGNAKGSGNFPTPLQPLVPPASPSDVQAYTTHRAAYLAKLGSLGN